MTSIGQLPAPKVDEKSQISGLHGGKLSPEQRARRVEKNKGNASRAGNATRPRGSHKKPHPKGMGKR